ncbi:MAG: hypothetical protein QOI10_4277, partial [Solirubrobacterales bacterium]|nr:hypothetical protein [Solirubrobacterales bacterium]
QSVADSALPSVESTVLTLGGAASVTNQNLS